jgi:orotate phosphoribosyltransferase
MNSSVRDDLTNEVLGLFAARRGHFRFESGHHGDLWLEIPPAYIHPERLRRYAIELAKLLSPHRIEAVCGPLVEGAFIAQMVAAEMDVEFYFAEQLTRAKAETLYPVSYRIPEALRSAIRGKNVAVIDDVINAGSAVRGTCDDVIACGAAIVAIGALLVLGEPASMLATSHAVPLETLARLPGNSLWEPSSCPLCVRGVKLEGVAAP